MRPNALDDKQLAEAFEASLPSKTRTNLLLWRVEMLWPEATEIADQLHDLREGDGRPDPTEARRRGSRGGSQTGRGPPATG